MKLQSPTATALGLLALTACGGGPVDPAPPETRPPSGLTIVQLAANHPAFFNTEATIWAKLGRDSEAIIYFEDAGGGQGESFAKFRVRPQSLRAFPDGRLFSATDSVLITLRIPDPATALVELLPSGLQFQPSQPAELKFEFVHGDRDLNDDGVVNGQDAALEQLFAIWRQEILNGPFIKLATVKVESTRELKADILGFSRFAIAY